MAVFTKVGVLSACFGALLFGSAQASTLTTEYNSNNEQNGNIFNISAATNLTITGFDQNFYGQYTTGFDVFYRPGGSSLTSAGWVLLDSIASLTTNVNNTPTPIPLSNDLQIAAGQTVGLYLTTTTAGDDVAYTNGSGVGNVAASNNDLTIYQGYGEAYKFKKSYHPRIWNGKIIYSPTVPEPASAAVLLVGVLGLIGLRQRQRTGQPTA